MSDQTSFDQTPQTIVPIRIKHIVIHGTLFALTVFTTSIAGVQWLTRDPLELANLPYGLPYAGLLVLMLASHELGHYFAARYHGVAATLPYFLPFPSFFGFIPFGTLGAVIRLKSPVTSRTVLFDIGAAGPIAGFFVSVVILVFGFVTLPAKEYLFSIHPEYAGMAEIPAQGLAFGTTVFYEGLARAFAPDGAFIPPMNEIYHYPFLCVGWFGMFVTAMNLIPIGQLDGGHISYAMFGAALYNKIAQMALVFLVVLGSLGFLPAFGIPFVHGWTGWLFWALVLVFFMRAFRSSRPQLAEETPLDPRRRMLGWICALILVGSFSLTPFTIELPQ